MWYNQSPQSILLSVDRLWGFFVLERSIDNLAPKLIATQQKFLYFLNLWYVYI